MRIFLFNLNVYQTFTRNIVADKNADGSQSPTKHYRK